MELRDRIAVIGSAGSGKSTLARQLGSRFDLPVVHLDAHYWRAGWVAPARDDWRQTVSDLVRGERWIIDGNYSHTMDIRFPRAETIIYLDFPVWLCMVRAVRRWLTYRGANRPDLPSGCDEKIDLEFLRWIWNYPTRSRPHTVAWLLELQGEKQIVWLRSPAATKLFLERVER